MILDMHCDTLSKIRSLREQGEKVQLRNSDALCCNLERLQKGGYMQQNFAIYIDLQERPEPYENAMELLQIFEEELEQNKDLILPVCTAGEMEAVRKQQKLSAMLTLEEGGMCCGDIQKLRTFYEKGARMMTLLWNYENELGYPSATSPQREDETQERTHGLKETGFNFLEEMEHMGMIIDVSHLSDDGFYDVYEHTRVPFVASHSNARALCSHKRNLSDRMLRLCGERGCVVGLNYYPEFLSAGCERGQSLLKIAEHAVYVIEHAGSACVGLGSDFDGYCGEGKPEHAGQMEDLAWVFHKAGISDDGIDRIFCENVMRLYREILRG